MKQNRGKSLFVLLFFVCASALYGSAYRWSASINKTKAMTHEAISLTYTCSFEDRGELYTIEFDPTGKNELYDLVLLREDITFKEGKRVDTYEFVAFVKKAQKIRFAFDMEMKKTTQDSIDNTIQGRDNAQFVDYTSRFMRQEILEVEVQESHSELVGSFEIKREFDSLRVRAHEPFHLSITLKGSGNFDDLKVIEFPTQGVKVFAQKPHKDLSLHKNGYVGEYEQRFAFVSESNFTIAPLKIEYFDLRENKRKTLQLDALDVEVVEGYKAHDLLDLPQEQSEPFYKEYYLYCFLSFVAGYLIAKIRLRKKREKKEDDFGLIQKINNAKDLDTLAFYIVLEDKNFFASWVEKIQSAKEADLKKIKKELIEFVKN